MRLATVFLMIFAGGAAAQGLDVPIHEMAGDGQAATCGISEVSGLKPGGDGFLALRSGPGAKYRKLGELHNGDRVTEIERRGDWVGIAVSKAGVKERDLCGNNGPKRQITGRGLGWVHGNWLKYLYP